MNNESERILRASIPEPYCEAASAVGGAQGYIADLEEQREQLRETLEECLDALVGCAVPAGGCDDKKHILDAQRSARAALKATEDG